jgi:hypothetical protein
MINRGPHRARAVVPGADTLRVDRRQTGSYPETPLWEAPNAASKVRTKVNPPSPNPRLVVALHSPNALLETGLRRCLPEKSQDSGALSSRAVHFLQSGLWTKYCEIRACCAYFGVGRGGVSLQSRLRGGEGGIRTPGTGLNDARGDVCVSYTESTSSEILRRLAAPPSPR